MYLVIDANVFEGFYKDEILKINNLQLTDSPTHIFKRLGKDDITFFDSGGHIKDEWRKLVEPEWFDTWYPNLLMDGCAYEIKVDTCHLLKKQLEKLGFPKSKDIWYIRTAKSMTKSDNQTIITEDLDFFDPKMKKCCSKTRNAILTKNCGPIVKYLNKKESININSVIKYLNRTSS